MKHVTVAYIGKPSDAISEAWRSVGPAFCTFHIDTTAADGRRCGQRFLGLGLDALRLAFRLRLARRRGPVIAMNPWTAVACRLLGVRPLACVGLYAKPGGWTFHLLRLMLGSTPVVATATAEEAAWTVAGGRARAVRWGGDFPVQPSAPATDLVRVFVGGTSDRDPSAVADAVTAIASSREPTPVEVHVADGSGPAIASAITRYAPLAPVDFHSLLSGCHVLFLPLSDRGRAAGHMVLAAALQAGLPVICKETQGMREYLDVLRSAAPDLHRSLFPDSKDLIALARADNTQRRKLHDLWKNEFSSSAFVVRIIDALKAMEWVGLSRD